MSEINKRTPRASETRSKTERRKPWRPASSLEAPQPPEGYKFRWVRTEVRGQEAVSYTHLTLPTTPYV